MGPRLISSSSPVFWKWYCPVVENVCTTVIHRIREQSGFFNLVLTERNMQVKFDLRLSVYSLSVDIWLLSFKFNFGLIGWPPQPPRERVPKINKIVGFWWSILHYETRIGHFSVMVDETNNLSNFLSEMRLLRSLRPLRLLRSWSHR